MQGAPEGKARLAVFDFDGTSIAGNSPVLLVSHLLSRKMLKKRVVFRILLWAAAYKLRLPQNEAAVRGLVFTAFEGKPAAEVDAFLAEFYDERIAPLFRPEAGCRHARPRRGGGHRGGHLGHVRAYPPARQERHRSNTRYPRA